jgi:hypothetical protein
MFNEAQNEMPQLVALQDVEDALPVVSMCGSTTVGDE